MRRQRLTHSGHRPDRNPAVQRFPAGVLSLDRPKHREIMTDKTLEALTDEEWGPR